MGNSRCPPPSAGHLAAAQRQNIDGVETDADPGHHLHVLGSLELRLAKARAAERHAMDRGMLSEHDLEILGGYHVWKFNEFDVIPRIEQRASLLRHRFRDKDLLLVGRHFLPLVVS